ncbi:PAS domain-containing protein [Flavobacterium sp.]|uniref:PAS domain-containing hybrid sensor histidine kinase/response regulator n=1 Tax=Flavobacterium sp. TaxID=239 RepID=UPI002604D698|nr:PAS domain-containing protein [Flavobacterium sp.]
MQENFFSNKPISNERRFSVSFEKSIVGMAFIDSNLKVFLVNNSLLRIIGAPKKEIKFKKIEEIENFKNSNLNIEINNALKHRKKSISTIIELKKKEDTIKLDLAINLFYNANKDFTEALLIVKDITEEDKKTIKAKELSTIVENSEDAIFKIDTDGTIVTWNKGGTKIFEYSEIEIIGKSVDQLFTNENKNKLNLIKNGITNQKIIINGLTKNKNILDIELTISSIKVNKKYLGKAIIGRDITTLLKKNAEINNYRNALNKAFSVAIINDEYKLTFANDNFCKLCGFKRNEIIGRPIVDAKDYSVNYKLFIERRDAIINGIVWSGEVELYNKSKEQYWVFDTIIPFLDNRGKPIKYLIIRNDITKIKLGENAIENKAILEKTIKLKDEFLANISHELRTPLNSVIGFTDLVLETDLNEIQIKYLNLIKNSGNLLLLLINDILDLTKMETGIFNFESLQFNLATTINEISELLAVEAKAKNIEFNTFIDTNIKSDYIGDPFRLQQIIVNLIKNAIKFTNEGSVSLFVKLIEENTLSNESIIEFKFNDTGIGIEASKLEIIFNAFTQSEEYITRNYGGFGLGLAIVSKLVKKFNGQINVESKLNVGTSFTVTIPFKKFNSTESENVNSYRKEKIKKHGKIKILLAEDNENNQILATQRLINWGFEVDLVNNGLEAIEKLKNNEYDLILMDIQMPIMDGYTATIKIRTELPIEKSKIPIVALTAHASSSNIKKAKRIGMNDYIYKPFKSEDLYHKIVKQLNIEPGKKLKTIIKPKTINDNKTIINFDFIAQECLNNGDVIIQYLNSFIKEFELFIENTTVAANLNDTLGIYRATHKILPSVKSLKIKDVLQVLNIVYKSSKENQIINYSHLIVEISMLYTDIKERIITEMETLKK